jgi:AbrB family looped-hinge helix DNA binding protein
MTATASLSTKGQVVIPKALRAELHLAPGTRFEVRAEKGGVLFQPIAEPEFDLEAIRKAVDRVGGMLYDPNRKMMTDEEQEAAIMKMLADDDDRIRRGGE